MPRPLYTGEGMRDSLKKERLRALPSVDAVMRSPEAGRAAGRYGRAVLTGAVRRVLEARRRDILEGAGEGKVSVEDVVGEAERDLARRGLRRVINATGVVLHTNLGRSVLSRRAAEAAYVAATGYSNLEYDLGRGKRGSRYDHAVSLLTDLTGAEDALVVNNCAGAALLALTAVARGGEVIVSRGQLVEIGGGFRIPEVLALSGAKLREVGTTNRTRLSDYEAALGEETRAILWVHQSNFETVGFTESVWIDELASLGLPVIADVGSGALLPIADEPLVQRAVRDGAAIVTFSGDKLLGGPQAGIAVGSSQIVSSMRSHPLTRALRADKMCLAALSETLRAYLEGSARNELPALRMLAAAPGEVEERARTLASRIEKKLPEVRVGVVPSVARSGGGTLPTHEVPSFAVRIEAHDAEGLAGRLRRFEPPVIGRVQDDALLLDLRTILPGEEEEVCSALAETCRDV